MAGEWWIYDEADESEPGWQLWLVHGAFAAEPDSLAAGRLCALGSRGGQHRAWMAAPRRQSLHGLERPGGWGPAHRRLLAPLAPGVGSEWILGESALRETVDSLLASPERLAMEFEAKWARARAAPRRWGADERPSARWTQSLRDWRALRGRWTAPEGPLWDLAAGWLGEMQSSKEAFLRELAAGSSSPGDALARACEPLRGAPMEEAFLLLASRMQGAEISLEALPGAEAVKAKRL